ncbi:BACON domain-containing protein [uncultured Alistipes sp.]|uniref:BACON domain-containing protein n=1 Tax=uncultured Alistipes sp. TaxID=538949 RepID=UPI002805A13B|nr:BACON domain-containing carbohydrate-binding protein [uncultured Alistipes sp.]
MNTKDLYRKIRRGAGAAALLLATLLTGACNDDDTSTGSPYFRLENVVVSSKMVTSSSELGFDVEAMVGDPTLELIRYDIRSNCDWTVEANSTDADWLLIWPDHGSGDGKVRFCVTDNDNPDPRATTVVFRYADGRQTEATLAVKQAANVPHITISVNNSLTNEIVAGRYAQSYDISVNANVDFFYSLEKNDWATLTETGNGQFKLDVAAYPEQPTELERSCAITFKGVGEYESTTSRIDILQTITPKIEVTSEDLDTSDNSLPPFAAQGAKPISVTLKSNWDWSIVEEADAWYSVSPAAGEADQEYTLTITPTDNTGDMRYGLVTIRTVEVLGQSGIFEITISQETGSGSSAPMTGLDKPVEWFFNGASGTDYTTPTKQFVEENSLRAVSGVGYLSFTHTYVDSQGNPDPDCERFIGGTGQPYVTGVWPGDYWLFRVPVKNFKAGTNVRFSGVSRISGTGQKYWRLEYLDGTTWKAASELKTTTFNGEEVSYTHILPTSTPNLEVSATVSFKRAIPDGEVQFRFICAANCTGGNLALENPNGGTCRWASSEGTGYKDSPRIEVVE